MAMLDNPIACHSNGFRAQNSVTLVGWGACIVCHGHGKITWSNGYALVSVMCQGCGGSGRAFLVADLKGPAR
jgi:DnaJ-class molecular chaperone